MCDSHSLSYYSLQEHTLTLTIALYRVTDYFPKSEILRNDLRAKANEIFQQVTEYSADTQRDGSIEFLTRRISTIKGYLKIAGTLQYVRPLNFVILEKEYDSIRQFLEDEKVEYALQSIQEDIKNMEYTSSLYPQMKKDARDSKQKREEKEGHENSASYKIGESRDEKVNPETKPLNAMLHEKIDRGLNGRQRIIMDRLLKSGHGKISDFYTSLKGVSSKTIQRDLQNLVDKEVLKKEGEKRWTVYSVIEN
ncbi:MAG: DeoR family transcriptional regulator [Patescibacteria group bacterium]|mgnify:FL=1